MNLSAQTDYRMIPAGKRMLLRMMICLNVPKSLDAARKRTLNLSLVLDRSGSMAGEKIRNVRKATQLLFDMMDPEDVFSLVAYDDRIEDIISPVKVADARGVEERIAGIDSRGSTCLSGGYERGCTLAQKYGSGDYTTRVILLSDGLANQGETRAEALGRRAAEMLIRGISTSTIGVGGDYNEFLMGHMAEHGGGGAHFVERAEDAKSVFEEEFGYLKSLAATQVRVKFKPGAALERFEQLNGFKEVSPGEFLLGDVYQGHRKTLVLEAWVKPEDIGDLRLGEVIVSWMPVSGESSALQEAASSVDIEVVPADRYRPQPPDRDICLEAAFLTVARAKREAIVLADRGDFEQAADLLERCATGLEQLRLEDRQLAMEIQEMRDRAQRLRYERQDFYSVMERKRMYHEFDKGSKGHMASMMAMKSRRMPMDRKTNSYPCFILDGHPVVETPQGLILVDTGAATSFGDAGQLFLFENTYPLAPSYLGQSICDISRLVGTRFAALVGVDILNQFDWSLDFEKAQFSLLSHWPRHSTMNLPFLDFMGVPIVQAEVSGQAAKLFFDSCAKLSYLNPRLIDGAKPSGEENDFYPGFGSFKTQTYQVPIVLSQASLTVRVGMLPEGLNVLLEGYGAAGLLGADLLNEHKLFYSFARKQILLQRLQSS